jgi:hypothetical protein
LLSCCVEGYGVVHAVELGVIEGVVGLRAKLERIRSRMEKFLNTERFQLLVPGPRMGMRGVLPKLRNVSGGHPLAVQVAGTTGTGLESAHSVNPSLYSVWHSGQYTMDLPDGVMTAG